MSDSEPEVPESIPILLERLGDPVFRRTFLSDPMGALAAEDMDGVPYQLVKALADLTYEELRAVSSVGADLRATVPNGLIF